MISATASKSLFFLQKYTIKPQKCVCFGKKKQTPTHRDKERKREAHAHIYILQPKCTQATGTIQFCGDDSSRGVCVRGNDVTARIQEASFSFQSEMRIANELPAQVMTPKSQPAALVLRGVANTECRTRIGFGQRGSS